MFESFRPIEGLVYKYKINNEQDEKKRTISIRTLDSKVHTFSAPILHKLEEPFSGASPEHGALVNENWVEFRLDKKTVVYVDLSKESSVEAKLFEKIVFENKIQLWVDEAPNPDVRQARVNAKDKLCKSYDDKEPTLGLAFLNLITLPDIFSSLSHLSSLDLSNCKLNRIPESIGKFTTLSSLNLNYNQIGEIPDAIYELNTLQQLQLSNNGISEISTKIGNLKALNHLDLFQNCISKIPSEIGGLTALNHLNLSLNQVSEIPPEIGGLTALKELFLTENRISEIPPEIGRLTSLNTLFICANQISEIPNIINKLSVLKRLRLSENRISAIPPEIGGLTALKELFLSNNRISEIPSEIGGLTALENLDLFTNQIAVIPNSIQELTALKELNLSDNPLRSFPHSLLDLRANCRIDITRCAFSPQVIAALQNELAQRGDNCPRIRFDRPQDRSALAPPKVEDLFEEFFAIAGRRIEITQFQGEDKPYAAWLNHLQQTSDFTKGTEESKAALANLVLDCFEYAQENPDFFSGFANFSFENFIEFGIESCVDRLTLNLIDLEIFIKISKSLKAITTSQESKEEQISKFSEKDLKEIFRLLKSVWVTYILTEIAKEKVSTLVFFDEIEVHLAYLITTKDLLKAEGIELPFNAKSMKFYGCAGVSERDTIQAVQSVVKAVTPANGSKKIAVGLRFMTFLNDQEDLKSRACDSIFEQIKQSWKIDPKYKSIEAKEEAILEATYSSDAEMRKAYDDVAEEKNEFYAEKVLHYLSVI